MDIKKTFLIVYLFSVGVNAQTVEKLKDESAVGQEKRQVFEKWGQWSPYSKKFLGIQTNIMYETVWVWDKGNRRYKRGDDIRPLKADGLENQRNLLYLQLQKQAEKVEEDAKNLREENLAELQHITNLTAKADILYQTYYKRRLRDFENIDNKTQFLAKYFTPKVIAQVRTATLDKYYEEFEVIQDKYKVIFEVDVPRGKRILLYHESFNDLRKFRNRVSSFNSSQELFFSHKEKIRTQKIATRLRNSKVDDKKTFLDMLRNQNLY